MSQATAHKNAGRVCPRALKPAITKPLLAAVFMTAEAGPTRSWTKNYSSPHQCHSDLSEAEGEGVAEQPAVVLQWVPDQRYFRIDHDSTGTQEGATDWAESVRCLLGLSKGI
jgi:hypothetical protein